MTKHAGGAPTSYKPEYCNYLSDFMFEEHFTIKDMTITKSDGTQIDKTEREAAPPIFLSTFARKIAALVHPNDIKQRMSFIAGYRQIFAQWAEKHPEFNDALKAFNEYKIERLQVNGALGLYNASFTIFTMKNVAGWRDERMGDRGIPDEGLIDLLKNRAKELGEGQKIKVTTVEHSRLDKFVSK